MTHAQRVIAAITEAEVIAAANPVLYARMAQAGESIRSLSAHYDCWLNGVTTKYMHCGDYFHGRRARRTAGKRQRQARKIQQRKARAR